MSAGLVGQLTARAEAERRLAAMLFVALYGRFEAARHLERLAAGSRYAVLREEGRQLLPVLAAREDSPPRGPGLHDDVPLMLHAR